MSRVQTSAPDDDPRVRAVLRCTVCGHPRFFAEPFDETTLERLYCPGCRVARRFEIPPNPQRSSEGSL